MIQSRAKKLSGLSDCRFRESRLSLQISEQESLARPRRSGAVCVNQKVILTALLFFWHDSNMFPLGISQEFIRNGLSFAVEESQRIYDVKTQS